MGGPGDAVEEDIETLRSQLNEARARIADCEAQLLALTGIKMTISEQAKEKASLETICATLKERVTHLENLASHAERQMELVNESFDRVGMRLQSFEKRDSQSKSADVHSVVRKELA